MAQEFLIAGFFDCGWLHVWPFLETACNNVSAKTPDEQFSYLAGILVMIVTVLAALLGVGWKIVKWMRRGGELDSHGRKK